MYDLLQRSTPKCSDHWAQDTEYETMDREKDDYSKARRLGSISQGGVWSSSGPTNGAVGCICRQSACCIVGSLRRRTGTRKREVDSRTWGSRGSGIGIDGRLGMDMR